MEEILKSKLEEGEEILWIGCPESFETMDKTHKKFLTIRSCVHAAIGLALILVLIITAKRAGAAPKPLLLGIVAIFCAYIIAAPFLDANTIRKKVQYAVTNKRMIVYRDELSSAYYADIEEGAFRTDEDGHVSFLCGPDALKLASTKWRGAAVTPCRKDNETGKCASFVLYAIPEAEKVKAIVAEYLTLI